MREIKFRAWNSAQRYWIADFMSAPYLTNTSLEQVLNHTDHIKVMQFTGLKDRNGREVYEGDILGHPYRSSLLVEWGHLDDGDYETDCYGWMGNQDWHERAVIGNIYENPELVK